ncbi:MULTISPECIES: Pycsar system effector family protein [unclassified Arcicella]|uniref:Pycsar system effector family protein n=1 Tax=unclassified Arcicella TaxID=2644986 RepID=UPI00285F5279|nr:MULTISPECIES: Pycsar system effector family protein [unclassified Arcicella]MDR6562738.1 putative metal-dependent HD superfamily phosphohydrolase [Arcicella sp. BE51]MDR6812917.1 putative metal-dependent HD superfamily phosphohydrolase [Arcicella sp. BE140]MDR6824231.1 putative metal-dependent HD superfamily phosphohydrolase [Arcicella sp. BE139]
MQTELLIKVQEYAEGILNKLPAELIYHNFGHTHHVVKVTEEIGKASDLSDKALETILIAAWLHDIGYQQGCINHEDRSKLMAKTFLEGLEVPEKRIDKVLGCIEATKMPQNPKNRKEMILCDADLSHLASPEFMNYSENLRIEFCSILKSIGEKKWWESTVELIQNHQYYTEYAREHFEPLKQENLKKGLMKLAQFEGGGIKLKFPWDENEEKEAIEVKEETHESKFDKKLRKEAEKIKKPERGIETMFRTTSSNHFQLSAMADNKANIMISVNSIIISLVLSVLARKLEDWPNLILPTALLTIVCLVATIFAILAVRPNVTSGKFSREDIEGKTANLLFFGNFHQMELTDYEWGMKEMMNDSDFLYASMTRDIYYLGKVLGKKYKFLRVSYTVFMFGFAASVVSFAVAMYFFK